MSAQLVIPKVEDLVFGKSPRPVHCGHDLVIGGGVVYPEINFTLPPMLISEASWAQVHKQYTQMIDEICKRTLELAAPGLVVEVELLPPMTLNPQWGAEIIALVRQRLDHFHQAQGLHSALRATIVDVRDNERPPRMRSGKYVDLMFESFDFCAKEGADLLSIESTGGKELHDEALLRADLAGIVFALGSLAPRDMNFLWGRIQEIAVRRGCLAAGDTACGFANTAMVLADRGMIPKVLASIVRVATVVRSLQAYLQGAVGPSKDCAYEGPYLKAMLGIPISMEGKSSACAHLSSVGNIAGACCDLWSNESVQNVKLLSATAPVVSVEQLIYDCRLMNQTLSEDMHAVHHLQRWLVNSDANLDPQAYVLRPDVVIELSGKMIQHTDPFAMTLCAVDETLALLERAVERGELKLNELETRYLGMLRMQRALLPEDEEQLKTQVLASYPDGHFVLSEYGM